MSMSLAHSKNLLTLSDASDILGVAKITLRRWERDGKIKSVRTKGGHRRFRPKELDLVKLKATLKKQHKSPTPNQAPEFTPTPTTHSFGGGKRNRFLSAALVMAVLASLMFAGRSSLQKLGHFRLPELPSLVFY